MPPALWRISGTSRKSANTRKRNGKQTDEQRFGTTTMSSTPRGITSPLRGPGTRSANLEVGYPISSKGHAPSARHLNDVATEIPAPHATMYRSLAHHGCHTCHESQRVTSYPMPHHLPLRAATNTTLTMPHPNPHTMSTLTPHPTPPLDHARRHGQSKIRTKIAINITMAHTPRLAPLRSDDPHPGLLYPLPPQSFPSPTLVPHPGPSYTAVNTINTLLSLLHPLPALHHGPLYPVASNQPHKTAEMPNNESRQSPE